MSQTNDILASARNVQKFAGQGTVSLFGFRLRSTGFALTATLGQIEAIDQNAKVAVKVIKQLDGAAADLDNLGKAAQAALDRTQADLVQAVKIGQLAQARYDAAVARERDLRARLDRDPEDENLINQVKAAVDAVNTAGAEIDRANEETRRADTARDAALADHQDVVKAVDEFKQIAPAVCAEIGKTMGLENVLFHENRFDPDKDWVDEKGQKRKGDYTNDVMSFSEKAENLLRSWAATKDQGAMLISWRKDKADEKPDDPLNPIARRAFQKTRDEEYDAEIEDEKTKEKKKVRMVRRLVLGEEAAIASKLGALGLHRKIFQRMMEDIVATVTKKHA